MVKTLKGLQDTLGRFYDREVQAGCSARWTRSRAEDGPAALMAMGLLVERLEADQAAARVRVRRALRRVRLEAAARARAGDVRVSRVLATYNIKGGVGKTSAAVNLAYLAARGGAPHAALGPRPAGREHLPAAGEAEGEGRRAQARARQERPRRVIKGTDHERLDLLPADFSYRHMDLALDATKRPTRRSARLLAPLAAEYDYVFLDCPPSISLVSESVFEAADALLVPLIPATLSSRTFEQLERSSRERQRARRCSRSSRWSTPASGCTAR